jgi:hypothetical protein
MAELDKEEMRKKKELSRKDQEFDVKMKAQLHESEKKLMKEVRLREQEAAERYNNNDNNDIMITSLTLTLVPNSNPNS